jgi:hypothetical protein
LSLGSCQGSNSRDGKGRTCRGSPEGPSSPLRLRPNLVFNERRRDAPHRGFQGELSFSGRLRARGLGGPRDPGPIGPRSKAERSLGEPPGLSRKSSDFLGCVRNHLRSKQLGIASGLLQHTGRDGPAARALPGGWSRQALAPDAATAAARPGSLPSPPGPHGEDSALDRRLDCLPPLLRAPRRRSEAALRSGADPEPRVPGRDRPGAQALVATIPSIVWRLSRKEAARRPNAARPTRTPGGCVSR